MTPTLTAFREFMTIVAGIYKSAYDAFGQVGVNDPTRTSHALQVTLHVLGAGYPTRSPGDDRTGKRSLACPFKGLSRPRTSLRVLGWGFFLLYFCYVDKVQAVILSYKLKLYPTRNKADTLTLLAALFRREHAACTTTLLQDEGRPPSTKGMGEFIGRAYRRAFIDYRRITKAGHTPGFLKAELIDSADLQLPKKARGFDYWILLKGTKDKLYIPARGHRALNRTLALPGAELNTGTKGSAYVMRRNDKWYAYVTVSVPLAEIQKPKNGWLGCDVGARSAVVRSDGYKGPDLRPMFRRDNERKRNHAYLGLERTRLMSPSRQAIAREARKAVTVCLRSGRGIALEAPKNLIRWKKHAARFFGYRVMLLAAIHGLAVQEINPAFTSTTCSRCGMVNRHARHKETWHCWRCGLTVNSDFNAALNLCHRAYRVTAVSHGSLSLSPGGAEADE